MSHDASPTSPVSPVPAAPASPPGHPLQVVDGLGLSIAAGAQAGKSAIQLEAHAYDRALDCVQCGLCLPACPTYTTNGLEADSPRGRIRLMKGLADGHLTPSAAVREHLDLCLDCRACETACPSGVVYHELIEDTRAKLAALGRPASVPRAQATAHPQGHPHHHHHHHHHGVGAGQGGGASGLLGFMLRQVLPYPRRLKWALLGPRVLQRLGLWNLAGKLAPKGLRGLHRSLPPQGPLWPAAQDGVYPAQTADGQGRGRVGFFIGCVGGVLFSDVQRQSIALLRLAGYEVHVPRSPRNPREQGCCGAIHHHGGDPATARRMAMSNLQAFMPVTPGPLGPDTTAATSAAAMPPLDFIVTDVAGCGAMLKDYATLLAGTPEAESAKAFVARVRDITQVLAEADLPTPIHRIDAVAAYHDPCHLAHAQGVTTPPRKLLATISGLKLVPLPESDMCCGAAGSYNLTQPAMADALGQRKWRNLQATGATICVTGNAGCALQIAALARQHGSALQVLHPVTLLYQAHFGL